MGNDRVSKKENDEKERMRFLKEQENARVKLEEQKTKLENFKQSKFFCFFTQVAFTLKLYIFIFNILLFFFFSNRN